MKVKVIKAELVTGISQKTQMPYSSTKVTVIFPDGQTAFSGFVPEDVATPGSINKGDIFDMYRDEKGYILVFDLLKKAETSTISPTTTAAPTTSNN